MNLLFDLDGTISNPVEGITKSINYALVKLGHKKKSSILLSKYIGPSLKTTFAELLGTYHEEVILEAIAYYRERYFSVGFKENCLYPGVVELLEGFRLEKHRLFIVTSKREDIASSVAEYFEIDKYFDSVNGCDIYLSKSELIRRLLKEEALDPSETVMIGDRKFDIEAGNQNGIKTIGVLWGYGSEDELKAANASNIVRNVEELSFYLNKKSF